MTRRRLSDGQLAAAYTMAIKEGLLVWRGARLVCAVCGRSGLHGGSWFENCSQGHPHQCRCGRRFASRSGIAAHMRGGRAGAPCPAAA
jgi:hypothetical protein